MVDRAPVYCDIGKPIYVFFLEISGSLTLFHPTAAHIQAAQNVAIPACSLCINRCLYRFATAINAKATKAEKRRAVIQDLLIGVGIPILQMVARECAWPFTINILFTRMQFRIHCFV